MLGGSSRIVVDFHRWLISARDGENMALNHERKHGRRVSFFSACLLVLPFWQPLEARMFKLTDTSFLRAKEVLASGGSGGHSSSSGGHSSSSGSSSPPPFCDSTGPKCPVGFTFVCPTDSQPTCLLNIPLCKTPTNDFVTGFCNKDLVSTGASLNIVSTPGLPEIIDLPLIPDEFIGKIGIAYPGSNPSFEIETSIQDLMVNSIDIEDGSSMSFANIPFLITPIKDESNKYILTLTLPDGLSKGEASITLNLTADSPELFLEGIIEIVDFTDVEIVTIKNPARKLIQSPPVIKRMFVKQSGNKVVVRLRGKNFVSRQLFYDPEGVDTYFKHNPNPDPITVSTVYPSNLESKLVERVVRKRGDLMRIEFKISKRPNRTVNAVLIIATPRGIVTVPFKIRPAKRHK